jgi:hypothetical protein
MNNLDDRIKGQFNAKTIVITEALPRLDRRGLNPRIRTCSDYGARDVPFLPLRLHHDPRHPPYDDQL